MLHTLSPAVRIKVDDFRTKRKSFISAWILFLLNPFSATIIAFGNYRSTFAKNILWLFVAYYGFTMVISDVEMDANRYRDYFVELAHTNITSENFIGLLYQEESNYLDAVQPLLTFIVSRLTSDPRVLFATFGLVFGFFYSRNIWFLLERSGSEIKSCSLIYIFVFAIIIGFWQINGFRMWTAAHVFFFGAFQYLMDNKRKGILIAGMSLFFHFSFLFPIVLLLVFVISPKKVSWFYWFFIITFFISEINIPLLSEKLANILPGIFTQRISGYTSDAYMEAVTEDVATRNWRFQLYSQSIRWAATGFLSTIYFFGMRFIKENKNYNILFCFALFFLACVNMVSGIPSVGRFYSVAYLFVFAFIYLYLQHAPDFHLKRLTLLFSFPLLVFYCLGMINISFMTIGIITLVGNPLFALIPYGNIDAAIIDLLK